MNDIFSWIYINYWQCTEPPVFIVFSLCRKYRIHFYGNYDAAFVQYLKINYQLLQCIIVQYFTYNYQFEFSVP